MWYFELHIRERYKTDGFLMFHFKIIAMDLFLRKYIKLKLFEPQQLQGYIWGPVVWGADFYPYVPICRNGHWGHITWGFSPCRLRSILFPSVSKADRASSYNGPLHLNSLANWMTKAVNQPSQMSLLWAHPHVCLSRWCISSDYWWAQEYSASFCTITNRRGTWMSVKSCVGEGKSAPFVLHCRNPAKANLALYQTAFSSTGKR